jgi:hypothetical protein
VDEEDFQLRGGCGGKTVHQQACALSGHCVCHFQ